MLDEINTKWKKNQDVIHTPKSVAPFEVVDDGGVQVLVARAELSMQDVVEHLRKRSAGIQNPGLKQYTDGSLVTLGADGTKSSIEPTVLALNETLIIFVVPNRGDTNLVNRVEVALP